MFRYAEPTLLKEMMFNKLGVTDKWDFVDTLSQKIADGEIRLDTWNRLVFEAANQNDPAAGEILRDVAANYAESITFVINELNFPADQPVPVVLAGSVFVKGESPLLIDTLREKVRMRNPEFEAEYTLLKEPPVAGAAVWALRELKVPGDVREMVCSKF